MRPMSTSNRERPGSSGTPISFATVQVWLWIALVAVSIGCQSPEAPSQPEPDIEEDAVADTSADDTHNLADAVADTSVDVPLGGDDIPDVDATAAAERVVELDLPYTPPQGGDPGRSTVDLFYLADDRPKRLVVLVHGGSWVSGDKRNFRDAAPGLIDWWLERDFVVAAVGFRLASPVGTADPVRPVDQARDIAHAIAWLDQNGTDFGITEPGVVAFGFSSGAHLVALLGADGGYLDEVGLVPEHIAATISMDVHVYDVPYALELMEGSVVADNIALITHLFGETEAEQLQGSPAHFTQSYVAPAFLASAQPSPDEEGTHGYIVYHAASRYQAALQAVGHTSEHHHWNDQTHSSLVVDFGQGDHGPTEAVDAFLDALF